MLRLGQIELIRKLKQTTTAKRMLPNNEQNNSCVPALDILVLS